MKKIVLIILLAVFFNANARTEEIDNGSYPDVSLGITAVIGSFNLSEKNIGIDKQPGLVSGAGITIEKMTGDHTAIGSGIQYRYFYTDLTITDGSSPVDARWKFQSINIPFVMIFTYGDDESSINLEGGIVYSHIFYSVMTTDSNAGLDTKKDDAMKYTDTNQAGITAGIFFRLKTTDFTDIIFGITGEYYPTNLLYNTHDSGERLNMFNYNFTAGYMFRTGFFPGSSD